MQVKNNTAYVLYYNTEDDEKLPFEINASYRLTNSTDAPENVGNEGSAGNSSDSGGNSVDISGGSAHNTSKGSNAVKKIILIIVFIYIFEDILCNNKVSFIALI